MARLTLKKFQFLYNANNHALYSYTNLTETIRNIYNGILSKEFQFSVVTDSLESFSSIINWNAHPFIETIIKKTPIINNEGNKLYTGFNVYEINKFHKLLNFKFLEDDHIPLLASIKSLTTNVSHNVFHASNLLKLFTKFKTNTNTDALSATSFFESLTNLNNISSTEFDTTYANTSQYSGTEGIIIQDVCNKLMPILFSNYKTLAKLELDTNIDTKVQISDELNAYYLGNYTDISSALSKYLILSNTDEVNLSETSEFFSELKTTCNSILPVLLGLISAELSNSLEQQVFNNNVVNNWIEFLVQDSANTLITQLNSAVVFNINSQFNETEISNEVFKIIDEYGSLISSIESLALINSRDPTLYINSRYYLYTNLIKTNSDFLDISVSELTLETIQKSINGILIDPGILKNELDATPSNLTNKPELDRIIVQQLYEVISNSVNSAFSSNNPEILSLLKVAENRIPQLSISKNYSYIVQFISLHLIHDITENNLYSGLINSYKSAIVDTVFTTNAIDNAIDESTIPFGLTLKTYYLSIYNPKTLIDNIKQFYLATVIASKFHGILNKFRI